MRLIGILRRIKEWLYTVKCEKLLRTSSLFDEDYYLKQYPDVVNKKITPERHYLLFGAKEWRNPSTKFDTRYYLETYPDVSASGENPLVHFIKYGKSENRECLPTDADGSEKLLKDSPLFDRDYYLEQYPDVAKQKITPEKHYLLFGAKEGRNPSSKFNTRYYLMSNPDVSASGENPLVHYIKYGKAENRKCLPRGKGLQETEKQLKDSHSFGGASYRNDEKQGINEFDYLESTLWNIMPIDRMLVAPLGRMRLNLVTDSLESDGLFGRMATALIVASKFAYSNCMDLRIITRTAPTAAVDYYQIMRLNKITPPEVVTFFCDSDRDCNGKLVHKLEVSEDDVFFATSWWSAKAIKKTSIRKRFYYILQEVETFFYPYGDAHYLCSMMMRDPDITYIVNSHYLWEHFMERGYHAIISQGRFFEPAFSPLIYTAPSFLKKKKQTIKQQPTKYQLFYYSRPNNPRNMFGYGIALLDEAIKRGILNTEVWEINMIGQDCPDYEFSDGYHAVRKGRLGWKEYGEFLSGIDLTLSLMYTPHPSYLPYDAACSGSVVLTNKFANKTTMPECSNVIFSDLDMDEFMRKMEEAIQLATDFSTRMKGWEQNAILRDWNLGLEECLKYMGEVL